MIMLNSPIQIGKKISKGRITIDHHSHTRKIATKRFIRSFLVFLFCFTISFSCAAAEEKGIWSYQPATDADETVWSYLLANHDDALRAGSFYNPVMMLASGDETEAWLVATGMSSEDLEENDTLRAEGYLVVYIQLQPSPKIIRIEKVAKPLEETRPTCEIKLLLDSSKALDDENRLTDSIRSQFQIDEAYESFDVLYLDTENRDYLNNGWINRIRVKEGKLKYKVNYKIRYDVPDDNIEKVLSNARSDGFSLYDSYFPAEIDWGYSKMTLNFSADVDIETEEAPDLLNLDSNEAKKMITENMPSEERNWTADNWGIKSADKLQVAGPIRFMRYSGYIDEQPIKIEIWPVEDGGETRYIVEFSADCEDIETAATLREGVIKELDEMGILIRSDATKTQMILDRLTNAE